MFSEAIKTLIETGKSLSRPVRLECDDPRVARFIQADGSVSSVALPQPPRDHKARSLSDLLAMVEKLDAGDPSGFVVWYNESTVVLVFDDKGYGCERATLALEESDVFRTVRSLGGGTKAQAFEHKAFVRLLRVDLAGALAPGDLLDIVRRVKFESGAVVNSNVQRSRESLGREVLSAVSAETDIPDVVVLSVPVYKTAGEGATYPVRCSVEADPMTARFTLTPFPDEIEHVQQLAMRSIQARLQDGLPPKTPAFYGEP